MYNNGGIEAEEIVIVDMRQVFMSFAGYTCAGFIASMYILFIFFKGSFINMEERQVMEYNFFLYVLSACFRYGYWLLLGIFGFSFIYTWLSTRYVVLTVRKILGLILAFGGTCVMLLSIRHHLEDVWGWYYHLLILIFGVLAFYGAILYDRGE